MSSGAELREVARHKHGIRPATPSRTTRVNRPRQVSWEPHRVACVAGGMAAGTPRVRIPTSPGRDAVLRGAHRSSHRDFPALARLGAMAWHSLHRLPDSRSRERVMRSRRLEGPLHNEAPLLSGRPVRLVPAAVRLASVCGVPMNARTIRLAVLVQHRRPGEFQLVNCEA